jgi:hypothetical protein
MRESIEQCFCGCETGGNLELALSRSETAAQVDAVDHPGIVAGEEAALSLRRTFRHDVTVLREEREGEGRLVHGLLVDHAGHLLDDAAGQYERGVVVRCLLPQRVDLLLLYRMRIHSRHPTGLSSIIARIMEHPSTAHTIVLNGRR